MSKLTNGEVSGELSRPNKEKISEDQLNLTYKLSEELKTTLAMVKGAKKLGSEKRALILSKLIKGQETLVKTQRLILGMDTDTGAFVNKGVIIIPPKANKEEWPDAAKRELDNARLLVSPDGGNSSGENKVEVKPGHEDGESDENGG